MPSAPRLHLPNAETDLKFAGSIPAPRLALTVEREAGRPDGRILLIDGDLVRLGSHESNDVVLKDPAVSRFHCRLTREQTAWRVSDLESTNGTTIHGVRVIEAELPVPEALIEIGESLVRVREIPAVAQVPLLDRASFGELFGRSVVMRKLFAMLERVAAHDTTVLIEGESGTGKELVVTELVRRSARARKPFVIVDCSSISPNLIEAELFGHARGAFTGADRERAGAFEAAERGTVFLDEIGEMPLEMQPRLLRVLEAREVRRIGETVARKIDVRVVAATNRRLEREVNHQRFREDLFFRLSVVTLRVPALRERLEDIDLLVQVFLESLGAGDSAHLFTREVMGELRRYNWPGNVRELRNFVERSVVLQMATPALCAPFPVASIASSTLVAAPPEPGIELSFKQAKERTIEAFEQRYLTALLDWAGGNVSRAARKAQMDRMNLHRLVQRYGLRGNGSLKD